MLWLSIIDKRKSEGRIHWHKDNEYGHDDYHRTIYNKHSREEYVEKCCF